MSKQKTIQPVFATVAVLMLAVLMFVFVGCNGTTLSASKSMDAVVAMWEQVKTDATTPSATQSQVLTSLGTYAKDLTLKDGLNADQTGVGQLLCFDFLTASLYISQTLSATNSGYKLGSVFSGDSTITQATADSYVSYGGMANQHIAIKSGIVNVKNNVISGEIIIVSPFGLGEENEFNFYAQFEATIDSKTYAVTDFKFAFYDNKAQNSGENVWYFNGVTYDNMKGIYINVSSSEVQAEKTFASKIKTNATTLYAKTATVTDKNFSTEMNKGLVFGALLTTALMA